MRPIALILFAIACFGIVAEAAVVQQVFVVGNLTVSPLCESTVITAVNGMLPGPTVEATEGDTLLVHIINESPYNMTIHWHGVFQRLTPWYDGPNMITQCPIPPGGSYRNNFTVTGQEGTLWWHAHISYLRATVHGALVIRPKNNTYPFATPDEEVPIVIGEWWDANVVDLESYAFETGLDQPNISDAFTINGIPGELYNCSKNKTFTLNVDSGKTYLLRIVNAALNNQHFFKVAGHNFTVVAVDASYTTPYVTDTVVIASGQTVDVLMVANATPAAYYMAAQPYNIAAAGGAGGGGGGGGGFGGGGAGGGGGFAGPFFDNTTATAVVIYTSANQSSSPIMPTMPGFGDTNLVNQFYTNLTSLLLPGTPTVPLNVDEHMFVTLGLGLVPCGPNQTLCNNNTGAIAGTMNNVSFEFPTTMSLLEAYYENVSGVYTTDFPDNPPLIFNYTNLAVNYVPAFAPLRNTVKGTKVKRLGYNTTVEIVLQNTAIFGGGYHPMHLHGYSFYVVGQGFGNYNATTAVPTYNLVNPQLRNTIAVPANGWAAIRFTADNPGMWIMHCHFESHVPIGLEAIFQVDNGPTPDSIIPPPPFDFPTCSAGQGGSGGGHGHGSTNP